MQTVNPAQRPTGSSGYIQVLCFRSVCRDMITVDAPDVSMWTDQVDLPTSHGSIVWLHHKCTVTVLIALPQEVFCVYCPSSYLNS